MNIGIDIDDTLTNIQPIIFSYAQKYDYENYGGQTLKDPYGYGPLEMFDWKEADYYNFLEICYNEMLEKVPLRQFARAVVNELKEEGNNMYIVTARSERDVKNTYEFTKEWLDKAGLKYDELFVDQQDKSIVAIEKQFDVFIDDKPINCEMVANKGIKTYIMDAVHNRCFQRDDIDRIYTWTDFYYTIKNINK